MDTAISQKYLNHHVFEQLSRYFTFYDDLAYGISNTVTSGVNYQFNIDIHMYASMYGTLESIRDVLLKGRIADSYTLLRRYREATNLNIRIDLYLKEQIAAYSKDESKIIPPNIVVDKINNWMDRRDKLDIPYLSSYIDNLKPDTYNLVEIYNLFDTNRYDSIRKKCNDYVHFNDYSKFVFNDNRIYFDDNRFLLLNEFSEDLRDLFIWHISFIFYLNERYFSSDSYEEYIEQGLEPLEGLQYNVAPYVQSIFDDVIKKERKDVADVIKAHVWLNLE